MNEIPLPESLFQALFEGSPGRHLILNPRLTIVAVSDDYLRVTMTRRQEILGRGVFEVFPNNPDDPEATSVGKLRASFERVLVGKTPDAVPTLKYDIRRLESEGGVFEERYWELINSPVLGPDGEVAFIIHTAIDVSRRVRAEGRSTSILESIADGFVALDSEWRFIYMNATAERLNGQRREEVLGRTQWEVFPSSVGTTLDREFRRAVAEQVTAEFENYYEPWDRWFSVKVYPSKDGGLSVYYQDITERKRAEEETRQLDARRKLALDSAQLGSWHLNPATEELETDERSRAIFGVHGHYVSFEEAFGLIHPNDRARVHEALTAATRPDDPQPYSVEFRVVHPDGAIRWVFANGRSNFTGEGGSRRLASFDGTAADITDRKRAEEDLRASEERYRSLFNSMDEGYCVVEMLFDAGGRPIDYRFLEVNPAFERQSGLVDATGKRMRELAPGHEAHWYETYGRVAETGEAIRFDHQAQALGGRWFDVYAFRLGEPEQRKVAVLFTDITERKRAEQRLRESEGRFRALVIATSDVLYRMSPDWSELQPLDGRGLIASTDVPIRDYMQKNVPSFEHGRVGDAIREAISGKTTYELEHQVNRPDGSLGWTFSRAVPILDAIGDIVEWFGTASDVTRRKEAEEATREQSERLREADRRKDEFLAMLAHELRNPLSAIGNAVKLASNTDAREQIDWSMDVITRQTQHLSRLIDDLMDVSRITRGKIELRQGVMEASPILESAAATVGTLVEERKHRLEVVIDRGNLWVNVDPTRLEQMVVNLLNNAAKYSENAGHIRLTARRERREVVISIKDRGVGIPPDKLPEMFELFAQADRSLARSEGGLGIGLTVVKKLVEMHGGSVTAESEGLGQGSEFVIRLPAASKPTAATSPAGVSPEKAVKKAKILVVDDNVDTARGMSRLLKLLGHDVAVAHDGFEAIEVARGYNPEFILLDIGLPGMSGYEVASQLRREECGQDAVIVAVSGYGQDEDRRQSKEAGFDHHLIKPLDHDALLSLLSNVGNGRN